MRKDDVTYSQRRAKTEVEHALRAGGPRAVQAHHRHSNAYLKKVVTVAFTKERRP